MFKEYLISAKNNNIPVAIYIDSEDTEKFSFGFIQGISNDYVLLADVSPYGLYDGFQIINCKDIYRCESKSQYNETVQKLYQLQRQSHPIVKLTSNNLILDLLQYARDNHDVVTIEVHDSKCSDLRGFVEIQDDLVTIKQFDNYGIYNGESAISFEDITYISCDSLTEMSIKLLAENS